MAGMKKVESFTVARDSFLEILYINPLLETGENSIGKVIKRFGALWMALRERIEEARVQLQSRHRHP